MLDFYFLNVLASSCSSDYVEVYLKLNHMYALLNIQTSGFKLFMMVWQIGKTKVFLRAGQMAELDARRAEVLGNAARIIQRQIRTHIARKEFIELRQAAIIFQSNLRGSHSCLLKVFAPIFVLSLFCSYCIIKKLGQIIVTTSQSLACMFVLVHKCNYLLK